MAGLPRVRRLLLVNALIFAVLAAAVALVYYGYSYATGMAERERVRQLMHDLALEKVNNIESRILRDDQKLLESGLPLEAFIEKLPQIVKDPTVHWVSVFVLDEQLKVIPGGYHSQRGEKEGGLFREWFERTLMPNLGLADLRPNVRGHLHGLAGPDTYLFSFIKKAAGDKTYYIVIEEDLKYLVAWVFPQYFTFDNDAKRLYQVVDSKGEVVYGLPFLEDTEALSATEPFLDTVDGWYVRVTEADSAAREQLQRKRFIDSLFIGGAITVILAGFVFLALAIRRERRANELKSEFISNVSHELKTPLSIITMFGEMLAKGRTKGPEQSNEYAEIIWRESQRLGRLIDNVLDFAKIERGASVYDFVEADIGEVVERAVDLVGRRLATAEMSIDVKIEPDLPHVQLDGNAFTLAVMNLIDNAIKYAAEGKKIELRLARRGERIVLTVRDFGPGIDPEEQEHIFERFYRARAVRLKPIRGSGIGLALVRHIARAHHGDVGVRSEPGKGATFELWLPLEV
jgi:two-component system phosphate regulon sensor histidine kinase PhoR